MIRMKCLTWMIILLAPLCMAETHQHGAYGTLSGRVVDAQSGEPVGFTYLMIEEIHFWRRVEDDGSFIFDHVPVGVHTLKSYRFGYLENQTTVTVHTHADSAITIRLTPAPLLMQGASVSANRSDIQSELENPDLIVADKKLRQNLGLTIAKTLESEPGLDQVTMGPAPARPVVRGLSGDRLLMLEDGERTGDLSATSSDHAVSIDPMTTTRIEVIRGPEALVYGASAIGGVINVVREAVPRTLPSKITGTATVGGESVSRGASAGSELSAPLPGALVLRLDGSYQKAGDVQTPVGTLENTDLETINGSAGLGLIRHWGYTGVAGGVYDSGYGIPPDPVSGHPKGVFIDLLRQYMTTEGMVHLNVPSLRHFFWKYQYSRYEHQEYESSGSLGMEFGVVTHYFSGILHFCECSFLKNAKLGIWVERRDYASGGLTFTPHSKENALAVYLYDEYIKGKWSLNGSLRGDIKQVLPDEERYSRRVGQIRDRFFSGVSGAISVHYYLVPGLQTGFTCMRSFRAPTIEELFSEGPHLAAYAYEVGNADLTAEIGLGTEVFAEWTFPMGKVKGSLYYNQFDNYLFPMNTGEKSWRRADLYLYRYTGENANFKGYEISFNLLPVRSLYVSGNINFVEGTLDSGNPLPRIPPLGGMIEAGVQHDRFSIGVQINSVADQNRIAEFETGTDGYVTFDVKSQYHCDYLNLLHTLSFKIENLGDTEYRRHLNRVKHVMPEPGRNFRLLYKVYF